MGKTTALRREVKSRFFPYAVERGFVVDATHQPRSTIFRRRTGASVEMFELAWDKYGRPRFMVIFGTCPTDGLRVGATVHSPDETLPSWCADAGSLQPRRSSLAGDWFRQDTTLALRLLGRRRLRSPAEVVDELRARFPEIERYWSTGELGPHIKRWGKRPVP